MGQIVPWLVFVVGLAGLLALLGWLASLARRSGKGRELMGPVDLMYRPHTHEINQEIRVQEVRMAETPSPGDPFDREK